MLVDSSVAFHACAKGRSPSRGLTPVLRKIGAVCLASGLFPSYHFVPTRLNPGDCPTRDLPLPPVAPSSFWPSLSADELYEGLALPKLRRWAANWARLLCLLTGVPPGFKPHLGWRVLSSYRKILSTPLLATLVRARPSGCSGSFWFSWVAVAAPSHGLRPRNAADERRSQVPCCNSAYRRSARATGDAEEEGQAAAGFSRLAAATRGVFCLSSLSWNRTSPRGLTTGWCFTAGSFLRLAGHIRTFRKLLMPSPCGSRP